MTKSNNYLKEESEEWQIITHLEKQGFHITSTKIVNNKLILLPAFEHSYTPTLELFVNYIESGFSLFDVSEMERKYFNVTQCIEKDTLYNHMSEENNAVLFKFLHKLILGESCSMTLSSFICPPNSKDYYYG